MRYRTITPYFERLLTEYPVITITGPRQSGKTTFCRHERPNYSYVNLEDLETRSYALEDPKGFLAQFTHGVILDEIQRAPDLPAFIQTIVDENKQPGQFVLTGSQQFEVIEAVTQSLAGRTALIRLLPFALEELYSKKNEVPEVKEILYTGFYPRIYDNHLNPTESLSFYLHTYVERDVRRIANIKDLSAFERFLKICATQIGQLINYALIANECGVDVKTVKSWISVLKASYIVFEIQPHFVNFHKRLVKSSKLYFYDVGLAAYLLGFNNAEQTINNPLKGALFENFVVSEFVKNCYHHLKDSNLYFFRDHTGHEVDLLLDYGTTIVSVEIKSAATINPDALRGLCFYQKLCGEKNIRRILIYGGETSRKQSGVEIYSYKDLPLLFSELNYQ